MVNDPSGRCLSVEEMQNLFGGSGSSGSAFIYKCTCYVTLPCGCVSKKYANVKATSQSAAESGVLSSGCKGYTSASCQFLCNIDGTH